MTDQTETLAKKIANASILVGAFVADKRNKEQGYDYISADQVLARGGNAIATSGFVVMPGISDVSINVVERANGKSRIDARVEFVMRVTDGTTTIEDAWVGFGSDYAVPDKAVYKAITSGHKYYLMKLLNIGAGNEDGEHENGDAQTTVIASVQTARATAANNGHEKMVEARKRYDLLASDAAAHGISSEPVEAFGTYEDLVAAGKQLKAALDKATTKNGAR